MSTQLDERLSDLRSLGTMSDYIQVHTTVDDEKKAREIARLLLETRVAACVQIIGPIDSSGWWKGKIQRVNEWICMAKARAVDYERIEDMIMNTHPYEIPEILAVPIYFGSPAYLRWLRDETSPQGSVNARE